MMLPKNSSSNELTKRMKLRKLHQDDVMSEFEEIKPYFEESSYDFVAACSPTSATPSEDIWKKFELLPTPPRSPAHDGGDIELCDDLNAVVNEFIEDCSEEVCANNVLTNKSMMRCGDCQINKSKANLIKDCMWNGVGHRPMSQIVKGKWINNPNTQNSHISGCVDPRSVFPYSKDKSTTEKISEATVRVFPTTTVSKPVPEKMEIPSDSDEEIDVVTVENPKFKPTSATNLLAAKANGIDCFGKKSPLKPQILQPAKVSKPNTILLPRKDWNQENVQTCINRGRARNKVNGTTFTQQSNPPTVTMLIDRAADPSKAVKVHLKPIKASSLLFATKRKQNLSYTTIKKISKENDEKIMNNDVVRLETCVANGRLNTSTSPVSRVGGKKRLSLDGVSFSATTGQRQYKNTYNRTVKPHNKRANSTTTDLVPELKSLKHQYGNIVQSNSSTENTNARLSQNVEPTELSPLKKRISASAPTSPQSSRKRRRPDVGLVGSSSSGSDSEQIRAAHNVLERQRREGLRASFHLLRDQVPDLRSRERTPKVNILTKARDYCLELTETEKSLIEQKEALKNQRLELERKLVQLRTRLGVSDSIVFEDKLDEMESSEDELITPESSVPSSPSSCTSSESISDVHSQLNFNTNSNRLDTMERHRTLSNCSDLQNIWNAFKNSSDSNNVSLAWQNSPLRRTSDDLSDEYDVFDDSKELKSFRENFESSSLVASTIF